MKQNKTESSAVVNKYSSIVLKQCWDRNVIHWYVIRCKLYFQKKKKKSW